MSSRARNCPACGARIRPKHRYAPIATAVMVAGLAGIVLAHVADAATGVTSRDALWIYLAYATRVGAAAMALGLVASVTLRHLARR